MAPFNLFLAVLIPAVFFLTLAEAEILASMGSPSASNEMCAKIITDKNKDALSIKGSLKYDVKLGKVPDETVPVTIELLCNRDRQTDRHTVESCSLRSGKKATPPNNSVSFEVKLMVPDDKAKDGKKEETHEFTLKCGALTGAVITAKTTFAGEPRSAYSPAFKNSNLFS